VLHKNIQKIYKRKIMFKKVVIATLLLSSILFSSDDSSNNSSSPTDMLTGDTKLACEAILCLSSGQRPDECNESIQKYFSIKAKKPQDTIKARQNFLNLCPVDGADKKDEKFADLRDLFLPKVRSVSQSFILMERCGFGA
jgi:hypothetical protein